jgi:hypothetical protein
MSTIIWTLIDGERTVDDIVGEIHGNLKDASVTEDKVHKDVTAFLDKLKEGGFITYE